MFIPRDYQLAAIDSIYKYFSDGNKGNPLVALPTGTGKSLVMALFIERVLKWFPGQRLMVLTHVKELIQQDFDTLKKLWPGAPSGVYSSGLKKKEFHYPVTFAGIKSVVDRSQIFGHHDIILIDEAHLVGDGDTTQYQVFLGKMKKINPHLKIIGLTATKYRVGMGELTNGSIFTDVCFDLTDLAGFNWMLSEGYLKPLIPRPTKLQFDLSGVHTSNTGEYNLGELQEALDKSDINMAAVREIMEVGHDRKHGLIFTSGVDHAKHIAGLFQTYGRTAIAIHSKMGDEERDKAIAAFKRGEYQYAVNNNILTTGFDFNLIDLIGVLRPSKSPGLWVQMLGRGTRPVYAGGYDLATRDGRLAAIYYGGTPNCLVLDFAKNTLRLGPINDPVLPKQKGASGGGGEAPVKECPHCGTYVHASVTVCPYCNGDIPRYIKIANTAGTQEVIKTEKPSSKEPPPPVVIEFVVDKVTYQRHSKAGSSDSLKVCYYTAKYQRFEEWVCLEHDGKIKHRAGLWWRERSIVPVPETISDALLNIESLLEPSTIRVRMDGKFKEILGYGNLLQPTRPTVLAAIVS